jgi:hypothetical protein
MVSAKKVTYALRAAKLDFKPFEHQRFWSVVFDFQAKTKTAFLFLPEGGEYFIAFSPIISERLQGKLEDISVDTLRTVIRTASGSMLTKFEYAESDRGTVFVAMSECSTDGFTGKKLHRRLEACARLAVRLEDALKA